MAYHSSPTLSSSSDFSSKDEYTWDTPLTEYAYNEDYLGDAFDPTQSYTLVTGGLGYIGSHTVLELAKAGKNVVIVDNSSNSHPIVLERIKQLVNQHFVDVPHKIPSVTLHQFDYRDTTALCTLLNRYSLPPHGSGVRRSMITGVIHFAAYKAVSESIRLPLSYYSNNVAGLVSFLETLNNYGIKTFVFSSSATVYGTIVQRESLDTISEQYCVHQDESFIDNNERKFSEPGCKGITNPYGRTKWMCEAILSDLCISDPTWTVIALRYFNPVGADPSGLLGEDPLGLPNNLMPVVGRVLTGQLPILQVFGNDFETKDGTGVRDFIHVSDLASGHLSALEKAVKGELKTSFRTFNLGSGMGHSVLELVNTMKSVSGREIPWKYAERREGDVAVSVARPTRAERELHWKTKRTLTDSCRDTYNFLVNNPLGYRVEIDGST